jgi:hypothetical protein
MQYTYLTLVPPYLAVAPHPVKIKLPLFNRTALRPTIVFPVTNFNPEAYSSPSTLDLNFPNGVTLPITYVYPNQ